MRGEGGGGNGSVRAWLRANSGWCQGQGYIVGCRRQQPPWPGSGGGGVVACGGWWLRMPPLPQKHKSMAQRATNKAGRRLAPPQVFAVAWLLSGLLSCTAQWADGTCDGVRSAFHGAFLPEVLLRRAITGRQLGGRGVVGMVVEAGAPPAERALAS